MIAAQEIYAQYEGFLSLLEQDNGKKMPEVAAQLTVAWAAIQVK